MDFKQIQELIKLVGKSGISELSIENAEIKLKIKSGHSYDGNNHSSGQQVFIPQPIQAYPVPAATNESTTDSASKKPEATEKSDSEPIGNQIIIKSPIVGTFYRSSGPDKEPFIKVGDEIAKGDVLCIIEAMKLFNEIESEFEGKIVKILMDDASPVEFDQPLFILEPQ